MPPPDHPEPASAIERGFPVREVNALAASEAYNKHHYRPTNYQHKWWARRLGSVFRTVCLAALSDPGQTAADVWARYAASNDVGDALVFDPFAGGGTTGQEATRLGAGFVGVDLNPVAWFVARMGLADPPDDLDAHYEQVVGRAREEVEPYFRTTCPGCGDTCGAQFYLWVELVGPAGDDSRALQRQYDSLVVDHGSDGAATVVCPVCHDLSRVADPEASTCGACRHAFDATAEDVRVPVAEPNAVFGGGDRPAYEPYAVKYDCDACEETGFAAFDAFDCERLDAARERLAEVRESLALPDQAIPTGGEKTRDLHARGYTRWTELFSARQLLALGTLFREVSELANPGARQFLALTVSASLEFTSMFCSYKGANPRGPGAVRHVFSHHAFVHPGEPLENNPLGTRPRQSGTLPYLYRYRLQAALAFRTNPVERVLGPDGRVAEKRPIAGERIGGREGTGVEEVLAGEATHVLHCGDAAALPFADALAGEVDAVVTDPPYFDSVQYAELADFFYVWLRQALEPDFPAAFGADSVVSDAEAVGNRSRSRSLDDYARLLGGVFETCETVLKPDGPLVFTFHHRSPGAWGALAEALEGAGFRVVATYPVRGENRLSVHINGQRAIQLDSVIVCRKAGDRPDGAWAEVREQVRTRARERLREYRGVGPGEGARTGGATAQGTEDLSRLDASVVVRGACLAVFSAYEAVRDDQTTVRDDATGADVVTPREAMGRVESVVEALNEEELTSGAD